MELCTLLCYRWNQVGRSLDHTCSAGAFESWSGQPATSDHILTCKLYFQCQLFLINDFRHIIMKVKLLEVYWFPSTFQPFKTLVCYGLYIVFTNKVSVLLYFYFLGNAEIKLVERFYILMTYQLFKITLGTLQHLKISNSWGIPMRRRMCNHCCPIKGNLIFLDIILAEDTRKVQ